MGPYSLPDLDREDLEACGVPITSEVERPNQLRRKRVNLGSQVADRVTLALQISYLDSHFAHTGNDNNSFGSFPAPSSGARTRTGPGWRPQTSNSRPHSGCHEARSAAGQDMAPRPRRLGARFPVTPGPGAICSRSSTIATLAEGPSSPRNCPSSTGTMPSATPPSETPSSTGCSTTRPPHHPQGRFHEAAVRLKQGDPHHPQPHLIHPCPAPLPDHRSRPDGLARNSRTASPGTGGPVLVRPERRP